MPVSLLATKLFLPGPTLDLVSRPRLTRRLDAGLRGRLILVSAPAGFGKTTLVAGWLNQIVNAPGGPAVAWLSLDEGDNTPAGFWTYLISALQTAAPQVGEAARAAFQSPQPPRIESVLVSLINDLAALPGPLVLVLDDFHAISTPEIRAGLDFLIEHLPPTLRLVIVTREDPPIALSRLRARGQLAEIRAADLQFTEPETGEFLNRLMSLDLPAGDIQALAARTEGWAAGLRLAALSLQSADDRHAFIDAFTASHRFLTDYLVDEVLSRLDPALRAFLRRTSILHRFSAALCDAVLGPDAIPTGSSQQTLRHLEAANLFVVPLDGQRIWYRYHHLFAQFLRMRLLEAEPELVAELYRRAAGWCSEQGLLREALTYALEGKDTQRAADLIEILAPEALNQEGASAVLKWMAALPEDLLRARPRLCLNYAWALTFSGRMAEAEAYLRAVEAVCGADHAVKDREVLLGYVAAHRAHLLFFQGEYQQTIQYGRQALEHLPPEDNIMRARTAAFLGNGLRYGGDLAGAQEAYVIAAGASQKTGSIYTASMNFCSLAEMQQEQAHLHQAMDTYRQALAFAQQHAGRPDIPFNGLAYARMGRILREWNDLTAAQEHMDRGIRLCREWRQADVLAICLMERSFLMTGLAEFDAARRDLQEAREIINESFSAWGAAVADAFAARIDLAQGDLAAASRWVQAGGLSPQDEVAYERGDAYQTLARVLIAQADYADALTVLDKLYRLFAGPGRHGLVLITQVWQARALAGLGDTARALAVLRQAMTTGEPENYTHSFVEAGPPIAALLCQMPPTPYRDHLLSAFPVEQEPLVQAPLSAPVITAAPVPSGVSALPEPLNDRELAVLRLLAAGRSNAEIGAELYLSVNTIRWYASQIYLKLGVASRAAAAAKSRELGIL